MALSR
jgi:hypothetical protein